MLAVIGIIVVIASVIGGYMGNGGHMAVLWQPFEVVIIFGAAVGATIISNPGEILKDILHAIGHAFHGCRYGKPQYLDALLLLSEIFKLAKSKGNLALESHIEDPEKSDLFSKYPAILKDEEALSFIRDYMRVAVIGGVPPHEIESAMEADRDAQAVEAHAGPEAVRAMSDAMPALGIVAAVLGVIHTMGSISEPPEVLGHLIGAALVGTFMGILLSYGFVGPFAAKNIRVHDMEGHFLRVIGAAIAGHMKGFPPLISVELARRSIPDRWRPTFAELEKGMNGG